MPPLGGMFLSKLIDIGFLRLRICFLQHRRHLSSTSLNDLQVEKTETKALAVLKALKTLYSDAQAKSSFISHSMANEATWSWAKEASADMTTAQAAVATISQDNAFFSEFISKDPGQIKKGYGKDLTKFVTDVEAFRSVFHDPCKDLLDACSSLQEMQSVKNKSKVAKTGK